jgi:hypothetical protein
MRYREVARAVGGDWGRGFAGFISDRWRTGGQFFLAHISGTVYQIRGLLCTQNPGKDKNSSGAFK